MLDTEGACSKISVESRMVESILRTSQSACEVAVTMILMESRISISVNNIAMVLGGIKIPLVYIIGHIKLIIRLSKQNTIEQTLIKLPFIKKIKKKINNRTTNSNPI